jgi:bifunctional UDP-N-acetylglucosamine pyrophosphorylase/glucosamine-1-phosphate N-acetyltransferase
MAGDTPLLTGATLVELVDLHTSQGASASVLTAILDDPSGYGRIIRDGDGGRVSRIVEHKDASDQERAIREINSGVYAFESPALASGLARLTTDNAQGEEYLTDVLGHLVADGEVVVAHVAADPDEILGVNDRVQLAQAGALLRDRINLGWMRAGVTIVDPATTWIDATVQLDRDVRLERNTALTGSTVVASGAIVGPDTTVIDSVTLTIVRCRCWIGPRWRSGWTRWCAATRCLTASRTRPSCWRPAVGWAWRRARR